MITLNNFIRSRNIWHRNWPHGTSSQKFSFSVRGKNLDLFLLCFTELLTIPEEFKWEEFEENLRDLRDLLVA